MQSVEAMSEHVLYRLSLDTQVQALAERLLERFAVPVRDLRASARTTTPAAFTGIGSRAQGCGGLFPVG
jgi:hypothetical protein